MTLDPVITSKFTSVKDTKLHYLEAGTGDPILLLHGWPTSAHLWRNIMPTLAQTHRVIALDLPGFGQSEKRLSDSYSFNYYDRVITAFLEQVDITKLHIVGHDLGGPIGVMWALRHPEKLSSLTLLNTLVYPQFSWGVKVFVLATLLPGVKRWLSSAAGVAWALRFGMTQKQALSAADLAVYQAAHATTAEKKVLLKTASRLSPKGFAEIERRLSEITVPVRLIYGEDDRILPKVATTMQRIKNDLPHAELTALPNCGHFLQEDEPEQISRLLAEFFTG